jgi:hypothetical protein
LRVSDRRDGQRDINQASIFAPTDCFIMVNAFASSDLLTPRLDDLVGSISSRASR